MSLFGLFSDKHFPVYGQNYDFLHTLGNTYQRKTRMSTQGFIFIILAAGIIPMFAYNSLICNISQSTNKNPSRTKCIRKMFFGLSEL